MQQMANPKQIEQTVAKVVYAKSIEFTPK